mmetsp:Transcript_1616/g.2856  ORF Transcript_1616/g.2856 Transcript_1616/m.2856 type:complete len:378 (-) Transcript_1616:177-1310(-)
MLLKPGEEFTADRVIELALRQDIGPDPSMTMNKTDYQYQDWDKNIQPSWEYKKKYRDVTPIIGPEAYDSNYNRMGRRRTYFDYDHEKPATFLNRPLTRNQLRKKVMRRISKADLDYYNTPVMTKFLTDTGKIYNRWQSRLPTPVQRKFAKIIKKMRHQFIIPFVGLIKPTDKIPLGQYLEDVEEMHKKTIDPVTGRMFMKYSLQDDIRLKLERERDRFKERFGHIENIHELGEKEQTAIRDMRLLNEMQMDSQRIMPNEKQRHWMLGQAHILLKDKFEFEHKTVKQVAQELQIDLDGVADIKEINQIDKERAKNAYNAIAEKLLKSKDFRSEDVLHEFLKEKAFQFEEIFEDEPSQMEQVKNSLKPQVNQLVKEEFL